MQSSRDLTRLSWHEDNIDWDEVGRGFEMPRCSPLPEESRDCAFALGYKWHESTYCLTPLSEASSLPGWAALTPQLCHSLPAERMEEYIIEIDRLNSVINILEKEMLDIKRSYQTAIESRNLTGIQLLDRQVRRGSKGGGRRLQECLSRSASREGKRRLLRTPRLKQALSAARTAEWRR